MKENHRIIDVVFPKNEFSNFGTLRTSVCDKAFNTWSNFQTSVDKSF